MHDQIHGLILCFRIEDLFRDFCLPDDDEPILEDEEMGENDDIAEQEVLAELETADIMDVEYEIQGEEQSMSETGEMETDAEEAEQVLDAPPPPEVVATPVESEDDHRPLRKDITDIPKTPKAKRSKPVEPPDHWMVTPVGYTGNATDLPLHEDLDQDLRLDRMILFDLRLWKKTRVDLRDLYISTVVNVPQLKRILGLRFSGLYTLLSQLYLVADREPDHSIINLSLQMLTSPSITEEVIQKGNFLTNLMAILYTFLTSRQVGFPKDVNPAATLVLEAGSVTNRRLYHFFTDLRYFLSSDYVQKQVRTDKQYLLQFLDLAKLSQGICPNVRAVGEHLEYETDAWISASLLTREIDKLCRQFAESFRSKGQAIDHEALSHAIFITAKSAIANSMGMERHRFADSEIKQAVEFKTLRPFLFDEATYSVVDYVVEKGALSFHHALHYTLSWLLECAKDTNIAAGAMIEAANSFLTDANSDLNTEDALLGMYDYPLRVWVWLAQMKASMWVRNGMSLRHQMSQYKGVTLRDVGHHRDIFMLQTALVTSDQSRVLASMIDRYGLDSWIRGDYRPPSGFEVGQIVDVAEDFIYLLVVLLSDRASLIPDSDGPKTLLAAVRKDVIHTLCFKPLSYTDLSLRLTERANEYHGLQDVLDELTRFRSPEGLNDSGMFELKSEYLEELDPYNCNYNKNQRDEAENIYKNWMAKKLGKQPTDIVLEPKLSRIENGAYAGLATFSRKSLFVQIVYYALKFSLEESDIPDTRVEAFLHVVLQLVLIATHEDETVEDFTEESMESFVRYALTLTPPDGKSIVDLLHNISTMDQFASCRAKIKHVLRLFLRQRPRDWARASAHLDFPYDRLDTASPANALNELEAKKKAAVERKNKVMAQMAQAQQTFMNNQGMAEWEEDEAVEDTTKTWKYPSGQCIQCREDTNDGRMYGTFAMFVDGNILRQTPEDQDWVTEVLECPDLGSEYPRPFGIAGKNHEDIKRMTSEGQEIVVDRQGLGKGWLKGYVQKGPISTGCGHIMHYSCFDNYCSSVARRQTQQIARNHPERLTQKEFVCPLCKALGNAFLPITWKGVEESYPGALAGTAEIEDVKQPEVVFDFSRLTVQPVETSWTGMFSQLVERPVTPGGFNELTKIYTRLSETITILQEDHHFDVLLSSFANSIATTEIAYRGHDVTKLPAQPLTHLRILADTARSYIVVLEKENDTGKYAELQKVLYEKIFGGDLLSTDVASTMTQAAVVLCPQIEFRHILQLCYVGEIIKVVMIHHGQEQDEQYAVSCVVRFVGGKSGGGRLMKLISTYTEAFLRKAVILCQAAFGIVFPVDEITKLLMLPSLTEVMQSFGEFTGQTRLKEIARGWIEKAGDMRLLHPCPLELIGLPKYYDVLIELSHRWKCPSTGKELTDPAICLFCGDIFCSQAVCCTKKGIGGCNLHIKGCSAPVGLFLNIRKCMILFLHVVPPTEVRRLTREYEPPATTCNGSWFYAPYLTKHGEVDPGLRTRHQLILNQKRYDKMLRDAWLTINGSIWSSIARKLEGEVNGGGWESL